MSASSFLCPICSKIFANKRKFRQHVAKVHAVEKPYKCNLCNKEFIWQSNLNLHVLSQHEGLRFAENKNFKCSLCGFDIHSEKKLTDHMRTHTGERPFNCTVEGCGMAFKLELTMKNHIKCKHSNERPFKCKFPGCHFTAKTDVILIGHLKVHSDDKPLACPNAGCNFYAKESSNIKRHVASVHGKAKPFACSKCDYKAARKDNLKYHMHRRHTTRRDFKCAHPQCTQSFKTGHELKLHFSNQHEERNVKCDHPGCDRKYANATALYKHKWTVHSKKKRYGFTDVALNNHVKLHNLLGRPFQCPLCFKYYTTRGDIKRHYAVHTKEKPFRCCHCDFENSVRASVKTHITSVHGSLTFPVIVHPLDARECLRCNVNLPYGEFVVHSMGHAVPVVMIKRLEIRCS